MSMGNTKDAHRGEGIIIAGPVKMHGDNPDDYFLIDPDQRAILVEGNARRSRTILVNEGGQLGVGNDEPLETSGSHSRINSYSTSVDENGGWYSSPIQIEEWVDVESDIIIKTILQWTEADSGNAPFKAYYTIARDGVAGVINNSLNHVLIESPNTFNGCRMVSIGAIAGGTLQHGDCISIAIQRIGEDVVPSPAYEETIRIARIAWLECVERLK